MTDPERAQPRTPAGAEEGPGTVGVPMTGLFDDEPTPGPATGDEASVARDDGAAPPQGTVGTLRGAGAATADTGESTRGAPGPAPGSGPASSGTRPMIGTQVTVVPAPGDHPLIPGSRAGGTRAVTARLSGRRRVGGGLVEVPRIPAMDPAQAIEPHPIIEEHKRFCWNCRQPVGRGDGGRPGALFGHCENCGARFSFAPALQAGDIVADQYEIQGALAHGGMGWIYLATDLNVVDRPVVLKGLLNSSDAQAQAVAVSERRFLAEMTHPAIVKIFNFVEHQGPDGRSIGYIVMEYVAGKTVKDIMADRATPLAVEQAIAYLLEVLPALGYLHSLGLAYNDLKPDNIMVCEEDVKLIDLGAVAQLDGFGYIYGTPGFQAPEVAKSGPTVRSDIYTVGRTLAVLVTSITMVDGRYPDALPDPAEDATLARYNSLYRLLRKATDPVPERRFGSAAEINDQLIGVLRECLSTKSGEPRPGMSVVFTPQRSTFGIELMLRAVDPNPDLHEETLRAADVLAALPIPIANPADPAAGMLALTLRSDPTQILDSLADLRETMPGTVEIDLAQARAHLELGEVDTASDLLDRLAVREPHRWRVTWYRGEAALMSGDYRLAYEYFEGVTDQVPGEPAPKLAAAVAAEFCLHSGLEDPARWRERARERYESVWRTDRSIISAAFGAARMRRASGDVAGTVDVLDQVPSTSRHYLAALCSSVVTLVHGRGLDTVTKDDLQEAARRLQTLPKSEWRRLQLRALVFGVTLGWAQHTNQEGLLDGTTIIMGHPLTENGLRQATETALRDLATLAERKRQRHALVDLANAIRPRTAW